MIYRTKTTSEETEGYRSVTLKMLANLAHILRLIHCHYFSGDAVIR